MAAACHLRGRDGAFDDRLDPGAEAYVSRGCRGLHHGDRQPHGAACRDSFFRWPLARSLSLSLPLACAGLALLFLDARTGFDWAHLLFLGAALLWAISVALMKNANPALGTATITAFQLVVAGLAILVASCLFEQWPGAMPPLGIWMWFLASVLLSTCLRFALQYQGQRAVPPARAAMLMSFEPVWTMALSTFFLATSVSLLQALGCAVIFAAVTYDFRSHPRTREEEPVS